MAKPFTLFDPGAQFIAADTGHGNAGEDDVGCGLLKFFQCILAVFGRGYRHPFVSEGEAKHRLVVGRVVGNQELSSSKQGATFIRPSARFDSTQFSEKPS